MALNQMLLLTYLLTYLHVFSDTGSPGLSRTKSREL